MVARIFAKNRVRLLERVSAHCHLIKVSCRSIRLLTNNLARGVQLEDRGTRYEPLLLKLFPPETRPRQREILIEIYRKGKIAEAFRAFKKIYLEIVDEVMDHLESQETGGPLGS